MLATDAPNVADWIAAIGQAAGALFTAAAVIVALWLGRRDRRWRREEKADRDAAQARLVLVEPAVSNSVYEPMHTIEAKVANSSSLPIFDVKIIRMRSYENPGYSWRIDHGRGIDFVTTARVLTSGETFRLPVEFVHNYERVDVADDDHHLTVLFTDSEGLRWRRTDNDPPERVTG